MFKYKCLNPIAKIGLNNFTEQYQAVDNIDDADGILVRSANMNEMMFLILSLQCLSGRLRQITDLFTTHLTAGLFTCAALYSNGLRSRAVLQR